MDTRRENEILRRKSAKGIGAHHRPYEGLSNDWLTPPEIIEALGPFDLDPCASVGQPFVTAGKEIRPPEDGLNSEWSGLVYLNPPYGQSTWTWLARLADHDGGGIALIFARTETRGFFKEVWSKADSLLFLKGRLHFHYPVTGERALFNAGAPSVLVAYGKEASARLEECSLAGAFVDLSRKR